METTQKTLLQASITSISGTAVYLLVKAFDDTVNLNIEDRFMSSIVHNFFHLLPYLVIAVSFFIVALILIQHYVTRPMLERKRKQDNFSRLVEKVILPSMLTTDKITELITNDIDTFNALEKLDLPAKTREEIETVKALHKVVSNIVNAATANPPKK
jgi:hypothetical protein